MFCGHLYCKDCDFRTEHFMNGGHPFRDFNFLLQNTVSKRIRIIAIPEEEVGSEISDEDFTQLLSKYKHTDEVYFDATYDVLLGKEHSNIVCSTCGKNLFWENTGIA